MKENVTEKTVLDFGQLKSRDGEGSGGGGRCCRHGNPHEQRGRDGNGEQCWETSSGLFRETVKMNTSRDVIY